MPTAGSGQLILNQFRDLGVRVIAADSGTELMTADDDPTRTLIRQVLGAVAQFERAVIVSKLKPARVRKRHVEGRWEGRKPFGIRPGEAEGWRRFRSYAVSHAVAND
ncbi:MAG: recombinase family protein [Deltaproteobacteria bacterium]|nr:recombinase family protein [Deltaproteobacteria bacterium]